MSIYSGPNVVGDSALILEIDAANTKSYPGSGTDWFNLIYNGLHGTLTAGPTFSAANRGGIVFDGVDDYIAFGGNPNVTSTATFETWCYLNAPTAANGWLMGRELSYRILYTSTDVTFVVRTTNNYWYTAGTTATATTNIINQFYQVVGVYDGSYVRLYLNGVQAGIGASTISGNLSTVVYNHNLMNDTDSFDAGISYGKGSVFIHRVYQRALSAAEIYQNFNATRGRFGL